MRPSNTTLTATLPNHNSGGGTLKLEENLKYDPYFLPASAALLGKGSCANQMNFSVKSENRLKNTLEVALVFDSSDSVSYLRSCAGQKHIDKSVQSGLLSLQLPLMLPQTMTTSPEWARMAFFLQRSGTAFAAAVVVVILLSLLMEQIRAFGHAFDPILKVFCQTSALALYPIFILLLGLGKAPKGFVIFWVNL